MAISFSKAKLLKAPTTSRVWAIKFAGLTTQLMSSCEFSPSTTLRAKKMSKKSTKWLKGTKKNSFLK
jgi:hypothetical protein